MTDEEYKETYDAAFLDDWDWLGANIPVEIRPEILSTSKMQAAERLEQRSQWSRSRVIMVIQLKGLLNLELPFMYRHLFGMDFDSCYCGPRNLLAIMMKNITGLTSGDLEKAFDGVAQPNTIFNLLSNSTLRGIHHVISQVMENLVDIIDLEEQDAWDNLNAIDEAVDHLSREVREDFLEMGHQPFFNSKVQSVVDKYLSLVKES
jgi:hypothetical protein